MSERVALGIDVGGTKTALALVAASSGKVLARSAMATPPREHADAAFLDTVCEAARALLNSPDGKGCEAIGLGLCELVDPGGAVASGHRVAWQGLRVGERLAGLRRTTVESDVRAAALAEARLGAGRPFDDFLYVNIGTGISTAWVRNGRPHRGAHGHALVLASGRSASRCPACGTGSDSILEEVSGGAGLARRYTEVSGQPVEEARAVLIRASAGDAAAQAIIQDATAALGSALAMVLGVLDPEALVVGGGLGAAGGAYWRALEAETRTRTWSTATRAIPMLQAKLGPDAGVIGAALASLEA